MNKRFEIFVAEMNSRNFLDKVLALGRLGAVLKPKTYPDISTNPKTARFIATLSESELEVVKQMKVGVVELVQYLSKEDLQALGWDEFQREALAKGIAVGGKGRTRTVVENEYLALAEKQKGV